MTVLAVEVIPALPEVVEVVVDEVLGLVDEDEDGELDEVVVLAAVACEDVPALEACDEVPAVVPDEVVAEEPVPEEEPEPDPVESEPVEEPVDDPVEAAEVSA